MSLIEPAEKPSEPSSDPLSGEVDLDHDGQRFDRVAAHLFPEFSRSRLQSWIKLGHLLVNGESRAAKEKVSKGELLTLTPELRDEQEWQAEPIDIDIVYEDDDLLVVNKPAGMVVHPGAGNYSGTLANAVLHRHQAQASVPRAGIVHRLDKETTGLLVLARTLSAHQSLVSQLQARTVSRQYLAICVGRPPSKGRINKPMGRHPQQRQKMAVRANGGKEAITQYETQRLFTSFAAVSLKLETGRTHQIRVHMADLGFPLLGDPVYGGQRQKSVTRGAPPAVSELGRQALHAQRLELIHPSSGELMSWTAPVPDDMAAALEALATL